MTAVPGMRHQPTRGPLQRALDATGAGILLEAQEATWRSAYGDAAVDEAIRRYGDRLRGETHRG